ncbi:MAG: ABC transporter ATP-binding protein, partial [Anaplasma sp.]|nr:ABC transporter ATP-binding protein [Anaplasma sp.]
VREGKIVQWGTPYEIYNAPKDAHLARFFGRLNYFESLVHDGKVFLTIGSINADGFLDGSRVAVCIRPDAILLHHSSNTLAVVKLVRFFNNIFILCHSQSPQYNDLFFY